MWSRVVEIMLGCWLLMSPFILRYGPEPAAWWINDFATGGTVIVLGLLSHARATRRAHLISLVVAGWLIVFAAWQYGILQPQAPASAAEQNAVVVGLLLLMLAVIPNDATRPPEEWV